MGEMRNAYKILVGKPGWKRPLGRPRYKRENNIIMDLRERGCGLAATDSRLGPEAGSCENGNELPGYMRRGEFLD
jgi:hypothetical protein